MDGINKIPEHILKLVNQIKAKKNPSDCLPAADGSKDDK